MRDLLSAALGTCRVISSGHWLASAPGGESGKRKKKASGGLLLPKLHGKPLQCMCLVSRQAAPHVTAMVVPHLTPPAWLWAVLHIPSPFLAVESFLSRVKHGLEPCCVRPLAAAGKETFGLASVNHYSVCAWGGRCWHPGLSLWDPSPAPWGLSGRWRGPAAFPLSTVSSAAWRDLGNPNKTLAAPEELQDKRICPTDYGKCLGSPVFCRVRYLQGSVPLGYGGPHMDQPRVKSSNLTDPSM